VSLQSIYSLLVYPPRIKDRQGSIIINLIGGESLPAFYFHDDSLVSKGKSPLGRAPTWGGQELLEQLEQLVEIVGSAIEPGVCLVNASRADKINHGAASPTLMAAPLLGSGVEDHPLQDLLMDGKEKMYPDVPGANIEKTTLLDSTITLGLDSATTTATGPITVEGMRRRKSLTGTESNSSRARHQQFASSTGPPSISSSGLFSGRPRTPLPFESQIDPLVNVCMKWTATLMVVSVLRSLVGCQLIVYFRC
jgi:hypothetical protein